MRFFSLRFTLTALSFFVVSSAVFAQGKTPAAATAKDATAVVTTVPLDPFTGESYVITNAEWTYAMKADGTGYRTRTAAIKIQSDAALKSFSVIGVEFASASEKVEWQYARVRRADGSVTETPVSGAIEQPMQVTKEAPFYSDLKEAQLPIKNLKVGDTLEWSARIVRTKAEAPGEFWDTQSFVGGEKVVLKESIELRVPATSVVTVWTRKDLDKPKEKVEGDEKVYRWESSQMKPSTGAAAEAEKKAKKTRVLTADQYMDYREGELPAAAWTTFKSWADVGAWYRGLEGDRAVPDDEIKAKVAELIAGKKTEEEKVRAVYAYVSSQIRYIGVAFGVGRFQPHTAVDVMHNQYGDCKDKETLLASMLAVLGVESDAALIGSELRFNEAVPSPAAFNHLITRAKVNGEWIWLDPTAEIAPYRMLYESIRDKQALAIPNKGVATLERTPELPPFAVSDVWVAKGSVDKNDVSDSHITLTMRGDDELSFRSAVKSVTPSQYDETGGKIASNLGFSGTVTHAEFDKPDDTEKPYTFAFDYHREKSGDWDNLKILPQLEPIELPRFDDKNPPIRPIYLGTPRTETSTAEMKIPEGWSVEFAEAVHEKTPFASYDLTYKFDKGTITTERKLVVYTTRLEEKDWKAYRKWADAVDLGMDTYIQLRRNGDARAGGSSSKKKGDKEAPGEHVSNQDAETLIHQAFTSADKGDLKTAETLLKRAKALDPEARRLAAAYGVLALYKNKQSDAIEEFQKELALYPTAYEEYGAIADAQKARNNKAGAEDSLRTWVKLDPTNADPETQLAEVLLSDSKYDEAITAAQAALKLAGETSDNAEALKLMLGEAQLRGGKQDDGVKTLLALMNSTDSPGIMNDAAYEMADKKLELKADEAKQHEAIAKLTAETQSWTLDESTSKLDKQTSLLVAAWDTMGWILYREGKAKEAEGFLEPAWINSGHKDGKDHLDKARADLPAADHDDEKKWDKVRTVQLGKADGRKGMAAYYLLIQHGKAERVKPMHEATIDRADELLKAADYSNLFPAGSDAKLLRRALVSCLGSKCELLMAQ